MLDADLFMHIPLSLKIFYLTCEHLLLDLLPSHGLCLHLQCTLPSSGEDSDFDGGIQ